MNEEELNVLRQHLRENYNLIVEDFEIDRLYMLLGGLTQYLNRIDNKRTLEFVEGQVSLLEMHKGD